MRLLAAVDALTSEADSVFISLVIFQGPYQSLVLKLLRPPMNPTFESLGS